MHGARLYFYQNSCNFFPLPRNWPKPKSLNIYYFVVVYMLKDRKSPELYPPEFVKVVYDEKGRVIDIIPAEDPSPSQKENELQTKYQNIQPINIKQDVLNWITSLGQQIKTLREDLRLTAIFVQKKFNELQPIILNQVENSFSKNSLAIAKRFEFVEKEISNLKNQYNSILKISEQASVGNNNLTKKLEEVSEVMLNRFNYLNSNVSAILKDFDSYL